MWIRLALVVCVFFCFRVTPALHPRFYSLNKRIDSISEKMGAPHLRHHHKGNKLFVITTSTSTVAPDDENLFDTYGQLGDDEDDLDNEEYSNKMKDDYIQTNEFEDSDDLFDTFDDFQAEEEVTEKTTKPSPVEYTGHSRFSQMKWERLGTQEKVTQERNRHMSATSRNNQGLNAAISHYMRAMKQTQCKIPVAKVISLQSLYPNARANYIPPCTVLHRCAEDTGCCSLHGETCKYKSGESVHLYVYLKYLGQQELKVEKLEFFNHTECECQKKENMTSFLDTKKDFTLHNKKPIISGAPESYTRCNCPEEFVPKIGFNKNCACECNGNNDGCIRMQKGEEHLSLKDRKCIADRICSPPHCEYGPYKSSSGRCPKFEEREEMFRKFFNSQNALND